MFLLLYDEIQRRTAGFLGVGSFFCAGIDGDAAIVGLGMFGSCFMAVVASAAISTASVAMIDTTASVDIAAADVFVVFVSAVALFSIPRNEAMTAKGCSVTTSLLQKGFANQDSVAVIRSVLSTRRRRR